MMDVNDVRCPICGSDTTDFFYKNKDGEIVGCGDCLDVLNAYEYADVLEGCNVSW